MLAWLVGVALCFTGVGMCVGIPWIGLTAIGHLVFVLMAGITAREGIRYRHPISLRFF